MTLHITVSTGREQIAQQTLRALFIMREDNESPQTIKQLQIYLFDYIVLEHFGGVQLMKSAFKNHLRNKAAIYLIKRICA